MRGRHFSQPGLVALTLMNSSPNQTPRKVRCGLNQTYAATSCLNRSAAHSSNFDGGQWIVILVPPSIGDGAVFRFGFNVAHDNQYGFAAILLYFDNFVYAVHSYARSIVGASS